MFIVIFIGGSIWKLLCEFIVIIVPRVHGSYFITCPVVAFMSSAFGVFGICSHIVCPCIGNVSIM